MPRSLSKRKATRGSSNSRKRVDNGSGNCIRRESHRPELFPVAVPSITDRRMKNLGAAVRNALVRLVVSLPDLAFYRYKYFVLHRKLCSFKQPQRFSEKIFHRMRYPAPVFSELADKVAVRNHIARVVGPQYLVPAYFSCDSVSADTFDGLPEAFVMKANNSAGQIRIVRSKSEENLEELVALTQTWLKSNFPLRMREKHYRHIPPKIIFEQALLVDGKSPADYKFSVFNPGAGEKPFIFIQYMQDRFENLTQELYLEDWSPAPFKLSHQRSIGTLAPRPDALDEMLSIAKKLAAPFGYLRVDFYLHGGKLYIGELTLTPGAGGYAFDPPAWDEILGDKFGWPEGDFSTLSPPARPDPNHAAALGMATVIPFDPRSVTE